jgi:hypothetical protein
LSWKSRREKQSQKLEPTLSPPPQTLISLCASTQGWHHAPGDPSLARFLLLAPQQVPFYPAFQKTTLCHNNSPFWASTMCQAHHMHILSSSFQRPYEAASLPWLLQRKTKPRRNSGLLAISYLSSPGHHMSPAWLKWWCHFCTFNQEPVLLIKKF